jgi:hypothetical protein
MVFMIIFCIRNGTFEVIIVYFEGKLDKVFVNFT